MTQTVPLEWSPEAAQACRDGRPLVALESALITHGLPWPENLEVAEALEGAVRGHDAVPATIAVMAGRLRIGLDRADLRRLARATRPAKISRADLAACLAAGDTGGTTVAATMIAAALAGIAVFATGGIGGVHHDASRSFDISADLQELARSPVVVVCAGAKAILDLPKTLEVLETLGVPVIVMGQDRFPGFWSRHTPLVAPQRCDTPEQIAAAVQTHEALGLTGGHLVAVPVPAEHEIPAATMAPLLDRAWQEAAMAGVSGKAVTPYLLRRLADLSDGASVRANRALLVNNATMAAHIACALAGTAD